MEKITDEQLIAYIEGEKNEELSILIANNQELMQRYTDLKDLLLVIEKTEDPEVPPAIGQRLQEAIYMEKSNAKGAFQWFRVAAAVLLLVAGYAIGSMSTTDMTSDEFIALRQEIQSLKNSQLTGKLSQHSASERIMAVNEIEASAKPNPELTATLINTLNSDESANVRYAALQALKNYLEDSTVKAELVKSLELQQDPLIQISLISILLEASERSAVVPLRDMLAREKLSPEVKKQAELALKILT
ncbi:MAG: HEAT repeat domain-containing protein [Cyclobacteriaceae bacterium]